MIRNVGLEAATYLASGAVAAGTTDVNGAVIDFANVESARGLAILGDVTDTAVLALKFQSGDASDGGDFADVSGATTTPFTAGASNADLKILELTVTRPAAKRYGRFVLDRGTANAVLAAMIHETYGHRNTPAPAGDILATANAKGYA